MDAHHKLRAHEGEPFSEAFRREYQSLVGALNYAAIETRLDISLPVGIVSRFLSNPN